MRIAHQEMAAYEEPTGLFTVDRLTVYDNEGNVVATVHYLLNNTDSAPLLLSAEKYDDLLQTCKELAEEKMVNSTEALVGNVKYKKLRVGKILSIFGKNKDKVKRLRRGWKWVNRMEDLKDALSPLGRKNTEETEE
ncbi:hypothetical protein ANCCAN_00627 [Ancylostoma caninum]|uniref:Uncharacterized protein n=1 Tax=Ancylostoma caninum TaxID=29170 RepID=A0A368HBK7_ANCCA|nr:hypothetical protein ANCCAN_00627 [Ancylostoma caninum]